VPKLESSVPGTVCAEMSVGASIVAIASSVSLCLVSKQKYEGVFRSLYEAINRPFSYADWLLRAMPAAWVQTRRTFNVTRGSRGDVSV